jgi:hypothetical protein
LDLTVLAVKPFLALSVDLALEDRLRDFLADLPHEGVKFVQGSNVLLLEELFQLSPVQSHRYLLGLFYPIKEVYTVFRTDLHGGGVCLLSGSPSSQHSIRKKTSDRPIPLHFSRDPGVACQ